MSQWDKHVDSGNHRLRDEPGDSGNYCLRDEPRGSGNHRRLNQETVAIAVCGMNPGTVTITEMNQGTVAITEG